MKTHETIQTQLDCKATASLQAEINKDLEQQDRSLSSLLSEQEDIDNATKDSD